MPVATTVSISASIALAVFGAALALLVIVQGPRCRSTQYFALCMAVFTLYGIFNTIWQVPQQFDLEPEPVLYITTTAYVLGIILLFNFVASFAGIPLRFRRSQQMIAIPAGIVFVGLVWTGEIYQNFRPRAGGSYYYDLTTLGLIGAGLVVVYLLALIGLLYHEHKPRANELSVPVIVLVLGVAGFSFGSILREHAVNVISMTISVVMVGRLIVNSQVFQPLADLNDQLVQKNAELFEATRRKSQFLANMSHELRTPLNSIIGYAELVINRTYGDLTDLQADRLQKVAKNGYLLLELINDVLDLSKIEAGRLRLTFTEVNTAELLDSMIDSFEPKAREKKLTLVRGYSDLPALWVDDNRVRQILANLLSNAIKFTNEGVVIVRGHLDAEKKQVVISVTDTGIGIDPENQERVFEAFHQPDNQTPHTEGSRLGLALTRRLTELHNGRIWFESVVGQGTTFHVALPAADASVQPVLVTKPGPRATGPVILAIDDNFEAVELLQDYLEAAHFRVYGTCSANEGLRMAHEVHPNLITLDVRMPGIDGWQVMEVLRRDPETAAIPILIITATDEHHRATTAGANGFMTKPVKPAVLLEHVNRLLAVTPTAREGQKT
jgi:signal transduction histidine kinase/CheY-like chemotaxis protein